MKSVTIPNTDIRASRLGFGTSRLHREFSRGRRLQILEAAWDCGITHFDTSPYYGYGLAEADLGVFRRGRGSQMTIATKFGLYAPKLTAPAPGALWAAKVIGTVLPVVSRPFVDWTVVRAEASLSRSLKRLGADRIDILFLHEPEISTICAEEIERWLETELAKGRIRAWGVAGEPSAVAPWVLARHRLAQVVQTRDSIQGEEANFLVAAGRQLQFTYGYFAATSSATHGAAAESVVQAALGRNSSGTVLVSTRHPERVSEIARVVM